MNADISTLKRSFAAVGEQGILKLHDDWGHNESDRTFIRSGRHQGHPSISFPIKRRSISTSRSSSMPIQTSPLVPGAFPSFMSVFGSRGADRNDDTNEGSITDPLIKGGSHLQEPTTSTNNAPRKAPYSLPAIYNSQPPTIAMNTAASTAQYNIPAIYQHRRAASISSDSTDSSPTTTGSTFDSPAMTDPSPSSSPESPNSTLPLSPFNAMLKAPAESELARNDGKQRPTAVLRSPDPYRPEASSSRNVKGLSLAMNGMPTRPATSSGIQSPDMHSTPLSPLKGPLKTGRRKPTNLSIQTPGIEKTTFLGSASDMPPTPSHRPSLQHFPTSPALPSLLSPITGPVGGMMLSTPSLNRIHSRLSSQSSISSQSANSRSLHDLREEDDHYRPPKSQETQERGYPNGPIKVYESGVFLYLEPNREEASRFDTIINVAKEIKSPFAGPQDGGSDTVMSLWRNEKDIRFMPEPQTAVSEISFKSAFEWPLANPNMSPTTPKAEYPQEKPKEPEYIHVRWDHNSELIDDLLPLCQIIDSRTSAGKTVLIHCQLGVSRSASLVLAYGLYKGYQPDFHSMYGAVKERSQWISPNMSLIYQLMDFRTKVEKGHFTGVDREPPAQWFRPPKFQAPLDTVSAPITPVAPPAVPPKPLMKSIATQTDELHTGKRPDAKFMKALPPVPLFPPEDIRQDVTRKDTVMADASSSADSTQTVFPVSVGSFTIANRPSSVSPRPLPLREHPAALLQSFRIPSHQPASLKSFGISIAQPKVQMDLAMQDVPTTPSLFSPRQTEFMANPFSKTLAGDLTVNENQHDLNTLPDPMQLSSPVTVDPRSPHQRSEVGEIIRSIDGVL